MLTRLATGPPSREEAPANVSTVWEISQQGEQDGIHPTKKPVEIFARPIQHHTSGSICAGPFSGSGSQLIAAEQQGRRCFAMELEPRFVQVAIERWEASTGLKSAAGGVKCGSSDRLTLPSR